MLAPISSAPSCNYSAASEATTDVFKEPAAQAEPALPPEQKPASTRPRPRAPFSGFPEGEIAAESRGPSHHTGKAATRAGDYRIDSYTVESLNSPTDGPEAVRQPTRTELPDGTLLVTDCVLDKDLTHTGDVQLERVVIRAAVEAKRSGYYKGGTLTLVDCTVDASAGERLKAGSRLCIEGKSTVLGNLECHGTPTTLGSNACVEGNVTGVRICDALLAPDLSGWVGVVKGSLEIETGRVQRQPSDGGLLIHLSHNLKLGALALRGLGNAERVGLYLSTNVEINDIEGWPQDAQLTVNVNSHGLATGSHAGRLINAPPGTVFHDTANDRGVPEGAAGGAPTPFGGVMGGAECEVGDDSDEE